MAGHASGANFRARHSGGGGARSQSYASAWSSCAASVNSRRRRTAPMIFTSRRTCSNASFPSIRQTGSGQAASLISGPRTAGSIRRRHRSVQSPDCRLRNERAHDKATGHRRIAHGLVRPTANIRPDLSFGPRQPIRQRRFPETAFGLRHARLDEPQGRLLGQRSDRNALWFHEGRTAPWNALCQPSSGQRRSERLAGFYNHRRLIRPWTISAQWPSRKSGLPIKKGWRHNRQVLQDAKRGQSQFVLCVFPSAGIERGGPSFRARMHSARRRSARIRSSAASISRGYCGPSNEQPADNNECNPDGDNRMTSNKNEG